MLLAIILFMIYNPFYPEQISFFPVILVKAEFCL